MAKESVFEPEISHIKSDEYYLFYEMMMQSLRTDNVKEGLNKSLFLLKMFLHSGNIALFRKNAEGNYVFKMSDSNMDELLVPINCIVTKTEPLIESKEIFSIDLDLSDRLKNLIFMHFQLDNDEVLMIINNLNKDVELEEHFFERLRDTMLIILKRSLSYERNTLAVNTDLLTGLDNRNSYELRTQKIDENDNNLVFGIFDLFRLKYVNDNYSHNSGDVYIKNVAKILNKYWPKEKVVLNPNGMETVTTTGHCVYRIGGDEFVLLTNKEDISLTKIKASLAREEVNLLDLDLEDNIPIGINYGIVKHEPGDFLKHTFQRADEIMQEDKHTMYVKYGIERRR